MTKADCTQGEGGKRRMIKFKYTIIIEAIKQSIQHAGRVDIFDTKEH